MDQKRIDAPPSQRRSTGVRALLAALLVVAVLVGIGYYLARLVDRQEQEEVERSDLDALVVALRENRNRLEVYRLAGTVTTRRETRGGVGDILKGEMKVRQPWSVDYFVDMGDLGLDDYAWDERTRTLLVRAPAIRPEVPNIDESRQLVAFEGPIITRGMQSDLRTAVARGARQQAIQEARSPQNMAAASRAASQAIAANLQAPLKAAGLGDVTVLVRAPTDGASNRERWDVSRSIAEVLAERAE